MRESKVRKFQTEHAQGLLKEIVEFSENFNKLMSSLMKKVK